MTVDLADSDLLKPSLIFLLSLALVGLSSGAEMPPDRLFLDFVKPLLESRCVSCHGPDKVKGGLRLDSREAVLKSGESGQAAVVPGHPESSLLLQAVMHSRKDLEMPPKEKLTPRDVGVLERWIQEGAPWPETKSMSEGERVGPGVKIGDAWTDPRNPIVRLFGGQRLELWSLHSIRDPALPVVRNQRWIRMPVDSFVLARLESAGRHPQLEADRRTLVRRLYFDLIGLPPTPHQMTAALADRRPDAIERLVEDLLGSSAYAEHWARLWLDVVRYSDSNGFDWDEFRPVAWRYRDYVIRSLREDKPIDQFIREQLAGDESLSGPPRTVKEQDALIATGYLRLGPQDNSAPLFNEQERARAELLADLTETTSSAFLGLTISCCRCHDHKYDPFSQADHFRMRAFFEPVKSADDVPIDLAADQDRIREANRSVDERSASPRRERDALLGATRGHLREERVSRLTADEQSWLKLPEAARTNDLKAKIAALEKKITPSEKEVKAALSAGEKVQLKELDERLAALAGQRRKLAMGLLMTDSTNPIPATHILFQGDIKAQKEIVEPGFLSVFDPNPADIRPPPNLRTTGRRLALAEWIVAPTNPLTSRVFVNRIWQAYFGRGLVETPNDFGLAGARPSDPDLLDWLATNFMRDGWSLKRLHRQIVLSSAYRQSSHVDPADSGDVAGVGRRTGARRLTAEQLRDALLTVSGMLTARHGGPPVWPELPPEVLQANPAFLDDNETKTKGWYPSPSIDQPVRSIYLVQKKTVRVPFLETFDLPENSVSCARRASSIVAPQALSLLNSPLAAEAANALARRVRQAAGDSLEAQVEGVMRYALQRGPTTAERESCRRFLQDHGLSALARCVINLNEFVFID